MNPISELRKNIDVDIANVAAALVAMDGEFQDKILLVELIGKVEHVVVEANTHDVPAIAELASWMEKIFTAGLLDQITEAAAAINLLGDFSDRMSLVLNTLELDPGSSLPDSAEMIEQAASHLGIETPKKENPEESEPADDNDTSAVSPDNDLDPESDNSIDDIRDSANETFVEEVDELNDESLSAEEELDQDSLPSAEQMPSSAEKDTAPTARTESTETTPPPPAPAAEAAPPSVDLAPEILDFTGTMFDESIIYEFIDECESHLDDVESNILELENDPGNVDLINEVFRPVHSIKGSAGFLNAKVIQDFAHQSENLLDEVRKERISITSSLTETLLKVIDVLKTMLTQLRTAADRELGSDASTNALPAVPIKSVISLVQAHLNGEEIPAEGSISAPATADESVVSESPKNESSPKSGKLGEILLEDGTLSKEQLQSALDLQDRPLGQLLVDEGIIPEEKVEDALQKQQSVSKVQRGSIKVDIKKLDDLVNLVGELVIAQTLLQGQTISSGSNGNGKNHSQNVDKAVDHLGKITKDLQDQSLALRMVPLKPVFQKMNRVVRDVAQKAVKDVELILSGEDTEVDKTVSENINDPLVHIIRNSVDHGVEPAEKRLAAGKREKGIVRLSAFHEGGNIVIEIMDDGGGLNRDKIFNKAVERGLVEPDTKLTDAQIYSLIMEPGFSTADKITDISGRGVGLDVVKKNIEQLRGRVEVNSVEGKGSTFTIKLPLTLAIIDGMVVRVGVERFILPTLSIVRTFRPTMDQITIVRGRGESINVRGQIMPLIRLYKLYDLPPSSKKASEGLAVIVEHDGGDYALLVDELLDQQQVVIKNLGSHFEEIKGIAGGTILGDGRVGLILDMAEIFEAFHDPDYHVPELMDTHDSELMDTHVPGLMEESSDLELKHESSYALEKTST